MTVRLLPILLLAFTDWSKRRSGLISINAHTLRKWITLDFAIILSRGVERVEVLIAYRQVLRVKLGQIYDLVDLE